MKRKNWVYLCKLWCVCRDEIQGKVTVKLLWNTNTLQPLFYTENWLLYTHVIWPKKLFYPLTVISFSLILGKKNDSLICSRYLCIFCERVKQNEIYACLSKVTHPCPRRRFYGTSKNCSNRQKPKIPKNTKHKVLVLWNIKTVLRHTSKQLTLAY